MLPELFYAQSVIILVRGRAARARREGHSELGASAIEWAIISAVVVVLALLVAGAIKKVVTSNVQKIDTSTG